MTAGAQAGPKPPGPVPSPCVDVCRIEQASGLCSGCLRTLDEIAAWSRLDDAAKRAVWALLPARRLAALSASTNGIGNGNGSKHGL